MALARRWLSKLMEPFEFLRSTTGRILEDRSCLNTVQETQDGS